MKYTSKEPLTLRFHHLLCLPLFEGKGYSDSFSQNMGKIKKIAETTKEQIRFICDFDSVCRSCPNKSESGCLLNEGKDKIEEKDARIAGLLDVKSGFETDYKTALGLAAEKIHKDEFDELCGQCRWYKAGVCSFEKWEKGRGVK